MNADVLERIRSSAKNDEVTHSDGHPKVLCGDIASGDIVVDSEPFKATLKQLSRKLLAVEMEAAGVMEATRLCNPRPRVAIIRGISDLAAHKGDTPAGTRESATRAAVSFAIELMMHGCHCMSID